MFHWTLRDSASRLVGRRAVGARMKRSLRASSNLVLASEGEAASYASPTTTRHQGPPDVRVSQLQSETDERASNHDTHVRPHIRQDDPLNLSILFSGGKESKSDSPSNGE